MSWHGPDEFEAEWFSRIFSNTFVSLRRLPFGPSSLVLEHVVDCYENTWCRHRPEPRG